MEYSKQYTILEISICAPRKVKFLHYVKREEVVHIILQYCENDFLQSTICNWNGDMDAVGVNEEYTESSHENPHGCLFYARQCDLNVVFNVNALHIREGGFKVLFMHTNM